MGTHVHAFPHIQTPPTFPSFVSLLFFFFFFFFPSPSPVCLLCSTSLGSSSALISQAAAPQLLLIWSEWGGGVKDRVTQQTRKGEREEGGRAVGGRKENGGAARGSCSVFIHLLISLPTSRLFISLSIYLFIHPSTHSAGNQPCIHSSPPIYRCGCHPPLPPNHASISLSIFPFPLSPPPSRLPIFYPSLPSLHLYLTLSSLLSSFIYIGFLLLFTKTRWARVGGGVGVLDRYSAVFAARQ